MNSKKNLKRNLLICLLAGSAVMYTLPLHAATSVIGNNTLPTGGSFVHGNGSITSAGLEMNVIQNGQNTVIKWGSFDVGGSATVNFSSKGAYANNFNTLNYVNSASASQIYGTINAQGGNIFIVNPAGVQIGNSAQINVGSLYVSSNTLNDSALKNFYNNAGKENFVLGGTRNADIELMSLGNINASKVTFEGDGRIVIDSERIKDAAGDEKLNYQNINIKTSETNKNNIIIGYEAYDETITNGSVVGYDNKNTDEVIATVTTENGTSQYKKANGYMWVEDVEQLQAIGKNANTLSGNYALRNSIDATSTANWNDVNGTYEGFNPIGLYKTGKVIVNNNNEYGFTGNFDGLDYNIFGLTINRESEANVGLFGVAHNANINNVTLVGGSITGGSVVGSVVGAALGNTHITNATNSASVTGNTDVGGIVGYSGDELDNVGDSGSDITGIDTNSHFTNLVNTGIVRSKGESDGNGGIVSNAGGLIGYMYNGKLDGNSYNLGDVSGDGYNVGGLVGHAENSTIGDGTNLVYNRLDVEGAYNVGGIVGNMKGTTVQNAENSGNVTATGHTTEDYNYHTGETDKSKLPNDASLNNGIASVKVDVANVGGIAGTSSNNSNIQNVTNSGDVSSSKVERQDYYAAGNVGGVVGKAVDTNIDTATNKENSVRGAHNVGGIAGYFGSSKGDETGENVPRYTVTSGINDGGDIMATGARNVNGFVKEQVRPQNGSNEEFIIGNIGGIVGYMDGNNVYVTGSANRGTVHTSEPADPKNVKDWEKAANVGGIVGKIDRSDTKNKNELGKNYENAAVANSYNTGDVLGYTGVGGVVGMMYNGEVAGSYNLGYLRTTRQSTIGGSIDSLNMGGIVGDTTEGSGSVVLYDVYNKGQIGDSEFNYFGRHVGGIVGRLSGTVEKAYNTGAIYNGYNVVGGIAGWMPNGSIENSFNTGNITVVNNNDATSQVGGIVGAASANKDITINNVYNLGTLRSFKPNNNSGDNAIGGIVGGVNGKGGTVSITNAYTTGNIYAALTSLIGGSNKYYYDRTFSSSDNLHIGSIYSENRDGATIEVKNTYYIKPALDENNKPLFTELTGDRNNANKAIDFTDKDNSKNYEFDGGITSPDKTKGSVDENSAWRIYDGNTPILNAFLPDSEKYFAQYGLKDHSKNDDKTFTGTIQYGTAYDPLLTIINTDRDLVFNFGSGADELSISNAAGIAVYGGGLTFNNFATSSGTGYFGGTIYADGALNLNSNSNIGLGSAAQIYGSAVNINTDGKVTIYGDITATGNIANGAKGNKEYDEKLPDAPTEIKVENKGDISINAGDVDVYGTLTTGKNVSGPGIKDQAVNTWTPGDVENPYAEMVDIADRFAHKTTNFNVYGNIDITANGTTDNSGNVNLYFGNQEEGLITTGGNLTVEATGDVYVDSDLDIEGNMTLTSTGKDGEVLLTLTNIGKVQANRFTEVIEKAINGIEVIAANENKLINAINLAVGKEFPDLGFSDDPKKAEAIVRTLLSGNNKVEAIDTLNNDVAIEYMHDFMHSFERSYNQDTPGITLSSASGNSKLTVDMWEDNDNGTGQFNFEKYDSNSIYTSDEHTFLEELNNLNLTINNNSNIDAADVVYVEVRNGEQLKGIQDYVDSNVENASDALKFNYALMGDINASDVENYVAIGTGSEFTGTFDGRGNRIIGLDTTKSSTGNGNTLTNAGIFSTIGEGGTVKNVNIYSGNFEGTNTAGSVAGVNNGRIEGVVTFGNTVTVTGDNGNAGGIVGVNNNGGTVDDVESSGSVIGEGANAIVGGLVGTNEWSATVNNSYSNSAVTSTSGTDEGLGGVVGVNEGTVSLVDSLGVTNGTNSTNVGGVIGINSGTLNSAYNESIVNGYSNVGGIIGDNANTGTVSNIVNATSVTGEDESVDNVSEYVGGLVGINGGSIENGRNNGTITGTKYVGGMVGSNAQGATLTNITNDSSAAIEGEQYVGGIAGSNAGKISATDDTLINRGSITGNKFVGGVTGVNEYGGTIENTISNIELNVKTPYTNDGNSDNDPAFFGGVVGQNSGTIIGATNQSSVDVAADGATYVGGIIGQNTSTGTLEGKIRNGGTVSGLSNVGGIIGENKNANLLNNDDNNERLEITNTGSVRATQGGAAGIFYSNNISGTEGDTNANAINNVDITNSGTVTGGTDENSVTGGLFGINSGNITNSTLTNTGVVIGGGTVGGLIGTNSGSAKDSTFTNSGTVSGNTNVGGLFGTNSGKFERSSLINTVNGQVIGTNNVGGLIGYNTGEIIGGRKDVNGTDVGYYKYKIYNNGVITIKVNGSNIGGLIGNNTTENGKTGSLTAGYNTGAINAANSENVGGIAGSNAGTIDQVFNTVMTENGQNQTIVGGTNVGGLVGTNSGTLSNAYNTTEVKGNANVGTIIGNNATNNVSNVYNTWDTENSKLISTGNSADNAYNIDSNKQTDYSGLGFNDTWKIYEGNSNPLLKVFLTNLTIKDINNEGTSLKEFLNLVYNGKEQDLNIKALIDNGFIVVPDEEALKAYHNTLIGNNLGESYLINNTDGQKTAGKHNNWLYSEQIHVNTSGEFNPNNLGYDITFANNDKGILEIDKAKLTITLDDIYRIYGQDGLKDGYEYGFSIDGLADSDKNLANDIIIEEGTIEDGALVDINNDGKVTNDVNDIDNPYKWTADVTLSDYIEQNYNILYDGGNSHVTKADLTITADNKETMPGVMPDFTGTDIQQGLVNGDSAGTYDYNLDGSVNIDVDGTYTDKIGISFDNGETYYDLENVDWSTIPGWDFLKNYDINFKPGTLIVSSELLPDIPSDWPHNRWDYLFNDAPFDRTKDFRERKAEVNFVDGGMEI